MFNRDSEKYNEKLKAEFEKEEAEYKAFCDAVEEYKKEFSKYYLDDEDKKAYRTQMHLTEQYIEDKATLEEMDAWKKDMDRLAEDVVDKNKQDIKEWTEEFDSYNVLWALESEETKFEEMRKDFSDDIKNHEYKKAIELAEDISKYGEKITTEQNGWNIQIVQRDLSQYPKVRLYLDIVDGDSNAVVSNINRKYFNLYEKQGKSEKYLRRTIIKATQLNQAERLNISMLADNSGSMEDLMPAVQNVGTYKLHKGKDGQWRLRDFADTFKLDAVNVYYAEVDGSSRL